MVTTLARSHTVKQSSTLRGRAELKECSRLPKEKLTVEVFISVSLVIEVILTMGMLSSLGQKWIKIIYGLQHFTTTKNLFTMMEKMVMIVEHLYRIRSNTIWRIGLNSWSMHRMTAWYDLKHILTANWSIQHINQKMYFKPVRWGFWIVEPMFILRISKSHRVEETHLKLDSTLMYIF